MPGQKDCGGGGGGVIFREFEIDMYTLLNGYPTRAYSIAQGNMFNIK